MLAHRDAGTAPGAPVIERYDARLDDLIPRDAALEQIAAGFTWVEGPVFRRGDATLLFSDIPRNVVMAWRAGVEPWVALERSGYRGSVPFAGREPGSNGLTLDRDGRLVVAQHGDRRIVRIEKDGTRTTLAERYDGKRLNSPNDLVYRSDGDLYFTDPPFGLPKSFDDPAKELDVNGVYRLTPSGTLTLVTDALRAPNGIAFSPSESTLYVSNADRRHAVWIAYDIRADGTAGARRVFFDATALAPGRPGAPDGMKVDERGNVFAAGPGGVYVLAPDGTLLGWIATGVATSNCAWGDDGSALYVTASTAVHRIRLNTKGAGF